MFEALGRIGSGAENAQRRRAQRGAGGPSVRRASCARSSRLLRRDHPPVPYPDTGHFPESLAGLAAMLDGRAADRCAAVNAPGSYDTHDDQPGDFRNTCRRPATGCSPSSATSRRAGSTTASSPCSGRSSAAGPRRTDPTAPITAPAATPFLIGTRRKGGWSASGPGLEPPRRGRQPALDRDFRSVYCSLLEQWFGGRRGAVIPGASGFARPGPDRMSATAAVIGLALLAAASAVARGPAAPVAGRTGTAAVAAARHRPRVQPHAVAAEGSRRGRRSSSSTTTARTLTISSCAGSAATGSSRSAMSTPGETGTLQLKLRRVLALPALVRDPRPREPRHGRDPEDAKPSSRGDRSRRHSVLRPSSASSSAAVPTGARS